MAPTLRIASGLLAAATAVSGASWIPSFMTKDVVIIGGGAGGGYAAVRLKEDFHKDIVVVEKASKLGGHVSTYTDPASGKSFDYGVQNFNNYGPAAAFFQRLGVSTGPAPPRIPLATQYADFTTGAQVNWTAPDAAARSAALATFLNVTAPWEDLFIPGWTNFPQPNQIPADLLLPFRDFVTKHNLHAIVNQVFQVTGSGAGNMMDALTLYVLSAFGQPMIKTFLGQLGALYTASGRNIEVYEKIGQRLGNAVLYNSVVTSSIRTSLFHTIFVKNQVTGKTTVIFTKKLLIAIQPTPANTEPLNLDVYEQSVLSKFNWQTVHAGLVSHPSLPINGSVVNMPAAAAPDNYLVLPTVDYNIRFDYFGQNLFRVLMVGDKNFSKAKAQQLIRNTVSKLIQAGTLPASTAQVQFPAWADHGPMHMHVTKQELQNGFIQKLNSLQGRRDTWWTGGAFSHQFQALIWAFNDLLLPQLVAA
ncbi:hypothetical protein VTJ83DRAFT_6125 [Remersonia thermophila]|uniref:Amine oxidase domain-containing protein n=1 Tax=Remersonia thermophila TaxID=72144 RepID=A0ABR4D8X7_9PEZI